MEAASTAAESIVGALADGVDSRSHRPRHRLLKEDLCRHVVVLAHAEFKRWVAKPEVADINVDVGRACFAGAKNGNSGGQYGDRDAREQSP